jgi:hypothetical protein
MAPMSRRWRKWGSGGADTQWLRAAGFTRRNTRRAILKFLNGGLLRGERILHLTSGTYRLQMGFLAITDRRVVVGMSWAFIPFINRRLGVPLEAVTWVRVDSNPWGGRLVVDSRLGTARLGDIEEDEAERLAQLIRRLSNRAKARAWAPAPGVPQPAAPVSR